MFLRILKTMQPAIEIYAYDTLSLAYEILKMNMNWGEIVSPEASSGERLGLQWGAPHRSPIKDDSACAGTICISKSRTQYYCYQHGKITLVQRSELEQRTGPIYCILTRQNEECDSPLIPAAYSLKDRGEIIRGNMLPNNGIETEFDPESDYRQWQLIRHH
jgi:hypothetical protein